MSNDRSGDAGQSEGEEQAAASEQSEKPEPVKEREDPERPATRRSLWRGMQPDLSPLTSAISRQIGEMQGAYFGRNTDPSIARFFVGYNSRLVQAMGGQESPLLQIWKPKLDFKQLDWRLDPKVFPPVREALSNYLRNLPDWVELAEKMRSAMYPPNLRKIEDLEFSDVEIVLEEGIPLYFVPRQETAEALIRAADRSARRAIVGRKLTSIVDDCAAAARSCGHPSFVYERNSLQEAIDVVRLGRCRAGQALAATVMDSLLWRWGDVNEEDWKLVVRRQRAKKGATVKRMEELTLRTHMVMMPAYVAHVSFDPRNEKSKVPIPQDFNRHASLHRISSRQYSKRNTAISLMLATSLLVFMNQTVPRSE